MQTLFVPDIVKIDLVDKQGIRLRQENILIGINTFATHKNNINISPFLSDTNGQIIITKENIKKRTNIFTDYGIMDYGTLESAKPTIQVYYWGNKSLNRYINYWTMILKNKRTRVKTYMEVKLLGHLEERFAEIEKRESDDLGIFCSCFNRQTKIESDIILVEDCWDKPQDEKAYIATLTI